jgi:hypothetical protein
MGYYTTQVDQHFTIPADKLGEAFEALKALNTNTPDSEKRGGSWGPGGQRASWFSWMDENYDKTAVDAAEIFEALGFTVDRDGDCEGGLSLDGYDSKTGQEDLFLTAVKDLVPEDSFIEFRGEDGAMYRWTPKGVQYATVTWGDPED